MTYTEVFLTLFKSGLPKDEVLKKFEERANKYREVNGLLQKYYIHDESSGEFGGIYIFDSKENLAAFRNSDLAKSIGDTYKDLEPPTRKVFNVNLVLYDEIGKPFSVRENQGALGPELHKTRYGNFSA